MAGNRRLLFPDRDESVLVVTFEIDKNFTVWLSSKMCVVGV
jgi:hypothetical protein